MTSLAVALAFDALIAASLLAVASLLWHRPLATYLALGLAFAAATALAYGLGVRARALEYWPLTSRFEFALWFVMAVILVLGCLLALRHPPGLAGLLLPLATAVLASAALLLGPAERGIQPPPPVLRSGWFPLHTLGAAIGYGAGASAGTLGIALILYSRWKAREAEAIEAQLRPAMEVCVELAFAALTLAILTGMVWAQQAWGEYWSWFPKETWALVTWLCFLAFLHARRLEGWQRRLPWLAILGLACVAFTLYGAPWLARWAAVWDPHAF